ncbi:phage tail protein [Citrobacter freundii]|uniref:phage tail protein n=1 Tax=Citrobacter freundii TaxID=546 RepID=UPI00383AE8B2
MIIGFGNNVVSALAGDITTVQTDIPVMPGTGAKFAKLLSADFENKSNAQRVYAKITLTDNKESAFEICHLVSVSGDVLNVIRGQEGTTPKGWYLNDVVANFATRGSENHFVQIAQLQSGHYVSGVAGGTANALTLELPATFFVNGGTDWALRTPLIVFPVQNNTGAATLQLTMGGRVLGNFPLLKGNKSQLVSGDIIKDVPLMCVLDSTKSFFSVLNPLDIYLGSRYLLKDENGADIPDKPLFIQNVGLKPTVDKAAGAVQRGGDTMTGKLNLPQTSAFGVNTDNALGGDSITLGDNDTGIKQNGDGVLDVYTNNAHVFRFASGAINSIAPLRSESYISAKGGVYEFNGTQDVRVYSPHNPPPATDLSAYATMSWVLQNFVQNIDLTAPTEFQFWDGRGYMRPTDGAAMYNFSMVGGSSNVGWIQIRYTRKLVNNTWYVLN